MINPNYTLEALGLRPECVCCPPGSCGFHLGVLSSRDGSIHVERTGMMNMKMFASGDNEI